MDENRAQLKNAIDKNIARIDCSAGKEMPPSIRPDAPMTLNPHGVALSARPARVERTTAADYRGPAVGDTSTRPTPLATGISPNVSAALPNQAAGVSQRVSDFLARK
jgi:hypothetical protein